jgi:pyruvate/2-oxoglutarate dehydrogenase complex dihydrolipoamide dehydrogenase (E3) component
MAEIEDFDILVFGSGEAGKFTAWSFASAGKSVAVVERKYIGGSCPNIACLPSKNIIHSAKVVSYFHQAAQFGITAGDWSLDLRGVIGRKRAMVEGLVQMHVKRYESTRAKLIMGEGRFVAPKTIEVSLPDGRRQRLRGEHVVISTGSRASSPSIEGLAEAKPLTHIEAMERQEIPGHLIVLGGGYVGLELAQAFRRFGSKVTVIDRNRCLVHGEDEDVSQGLTEICALEGIDLLLDTTIERVTGFSGEKVQLTIRRAGVSDSIRGSHLLAALGRVPNTDNLGLELAKVEWMRTDTFALTIRSELPPIRSGP